ncbi:MAG: hypothetical protein Kow00109_00510 [Acidobacteriota bacterium]
MAGYVLDRLSCYWRFCRPFTLLLPAVGMLAASLAALGAGAGGAHLEAPGGVWRLGLRIVVGMLAAALLNVFSNGINQVYDRVADAINKPRRMLPSGRMTEREAWLLSLLGGALALGAAAWLGPATALLFVAGAACTWAYSAPPLRLKARGWWANLAVALPRGMLLWLAGWSVVGSLEPADPWWIGGVLGLFFLGAVTTKDFSDVPGDLRAGCRTLPILWGLETTVRRIAPFFVAPFLLLAGLGRAGSLQGSAPILTVVGVAGAGWGGYILRMLWATVRGGERDPVHAEEWENHPAWRHMYLLTLFVQVGVAVAYWWKP